MITIRYRPPGANCELEISGDNLRQAFEELTAANDVMSFQKCGNPECGSVEIAPKMRVAKKSDGTNFTVPSWVCRVCGANIGLHTTQDMKSIYTKWDDEWFVRPDDKKSADPPI